jgi:hypothetical protein
MTDKSLKKFCNLSKYIKQKDPNLFDAFDQLCNLSLLRPNRDTNGITLLYPKDKAYRQKIIKAAYSTNPNMASSMMRSLILQDNYKSPSAFSGNVVNLLNQKLDIAEASDKHVKLSNGITLTKAPDFEVLGPRDNMSVYILEGKNEIPLNGTVIAIERRQPKTGGDSSTTSENNVHALLASKYKDELNKYENIFVKKVYLQLKYIEKCADGGSPEIINFLGNDEFSDSYLLDMLFREKYPNCFEYILSALSDDLKDKTDNITREKYMALKKSFVDKFNVNYTYTKVDAKTRMSDIRSPMEIRERISVLYNNDTEKICKDLFIVFCNIYKDLWVTDSSPAERFAAFAYLADNIYTCCNKLSQQEFDVARDLTLYGNLLKSDVLLFNPSVIFNAPDNQFSIVTSMPSPLDMNLYSLTSYTTQLTQMSGRGPSNKYLDDMLEGL